VEGPEKIEEHRRAQITCAYRVDSARQLSIRLAIRFLELFKSHRLSEAALDARRMKVSLFFPLVLSLIIHLLCICHDFMIFGRIWVWVCVCWV